MTDQQIFEIIRECRREVEHEVLRERAAQMREMPFAPVNCRCVMLPLEDDDA